MGLETLDDGIRRVGGRAGSREWERAAQALHARGRSFLSLVSARSSNERLVFQLGLTAFTSSAGENAPKITILFHL